MGANGPKPKPVYLHEEGKKFILSQIERFVDREVTPERYGLDPNTAKVLEGHDLVLTNYNLGYGGYSYEVLVPFKLRALIEHQGKEVFRVRYNYPDRYTQHTMFEFTCQWTELHKKLCSAWLLVQKWTEDSVQREIKGRFLLAQRTGKKKK